MLPSLVHFTMLVKFVARASVNKNAHELPKQHSNGGEGKDGNSIVVKEKFVSTVLARIAVV